MDQSGILNIKYIMIIGDYNASLSVDESWGDRAKRDPLVDKVGKIFLDSGFINIKPSPLVPTWTNRRSGHNFISKRLDRIMMKVPLNTMLGNVRTSVFPSFTSDHMAISLTWKRGERTSGIPFKFNGIQLQDLAFNKLVIEFWN